MKAIETVYNGYRFRSRLEARWAVFFDALGLKYEYEKEGYDLAEAGWYLPDFWLPDLNCWIEIKGQEPTPAEKLKAMYLCIHTERDIYIFGDCEYGTYLALFHFVESEDDSIPPGVHYDGVELYKTKKGYTFGGHWKNDDNYRWMISAYGSPSIFPYSQIPGYPDSPSYTIRVSWLRIQQRVKPALSMGSVESRHNPCCRDI